MLDSVRPPKQINAVSLRGLQGGDGASRVIPIEGRHISTEYYTRRVERKGSIPKSDTACMRVAPSNVSCETSAPARSPWPGKGTSEQKRGTTQSYTWAHLTAYSGFTSPLKTRLETQCITIHDFDKADSA